MALTLAEIITAARDRSPLFHRSRVPNAVVARYLTGLQRRLISKASEVDNEYVAQQASVIFAVAPENAIGVVGAGTAGGLPASVISGQPVEQELPAGGMLEMDFENAQVLVAQSVVSAASVTTLQKVGAGWVVNAYTGKYAWISDGPGINQRRAILSNTADTLTISVGADGQQWTTVPVAGQSMFEIVTPTPEVTGELGVVTALPSLATRIGYLVRLNSQGVPYIDLAKPLVAQYQVGIDLPPHEEILGGAVRYTTGDDCDLEVRRYGQRWTLGGSGYGAYVMNGKLFLVGESAIWGGVASIDLRYVPIAPALVALTDYLLLPDTAYDALVARSAHLMAGRINGLPDSPKIDTKPFFDEAEEAESTWLASVGRKARSQPKYVREVW